MARDLTLEGAIEALDAFATSVGPKCIVFTTLNTKGLGYSKSALLGANVYPKGIGSGFAMLSARGNTWLDLIADCERVWEAHTDTHAVTTIREMALAIISITADQGECTDAALRATFDATDIARYGERACAQATEMAGLGPFSIVTLSGANAVAAE